KNKPNSNPIQTQSNPIKANKMPKQTQFKPKQTQSVVSLPALSVVERSNPFQRQKMRMRLTINGWCKSFGYLRSFCADKIRKAIYLNGQSKHCTKIPHRSGV
ncbi:MAG TPA: hypothetical protein HPP66_14400, partial [Planctomycetes bacterium]|nr:hypothetical protein [Planctomycetota bacterium]